VQVYGACQKGSAGGYEWAFVAPDAGSFRRAWEQGRRHYAGPHLGATDASKILGTVKDVPSAVATPPLATACPEASTCSEGLFSKVTSIQRVNYVGGRRAIRRLL